MTVPTFLQSLSPRESVADALARVIQAYDTNSLELFESALTEDATFDAAGNLWEGRDAIREANFDKVASMDTTHFVTNHRIHIEPNGNEAHMTANALSQHYRPGEGTRPGAPYFLAGAQYEIDLVRDGSADGLWKVKKWVLKPVWTQGDRSIMYE